MVTIKNDTIRSHVQMKSLSDSLKVDLQLITNANFLVFFVTQKDMISFVLSGRTSIPSFPLIR